MSNTPKFVRCKDSTLVRDVLTIDNVYEVRGEQNGNYLVAGLWLTKGRFEPATYEEWTGQ